MEKTEQKKEESQDLVITRTFDAPLEHVWKAWTDTEIFKQWWGPKGFTCPAAEIDLRVGGEYFNCMLSPEGKEYWSRGIYQEIVPLEKLVMTDSFADEHGHPVPATHYGMSADFPMEMLVTVEFKEEDGPSADEAGKTTLTLRHEGMPAGEQDGARQGWSESLDKLAETLNSQKERAAAHAMPREAEQM